MIDKDKNSLSPFIHDLSPRWSLLLSDSENSGYAVRSAHPNCPYGQLSHTLETLYAISRYGGKSL